MFRRWFAVEKRQWRMKCILVSTATTEGAQEETHRRVELCARDTFVIRPITSHQLTTFSPGQVLSTWLCGACLLCGGRVYARCGAALWFPEKEQRAGGSDWLGPLGVVSARLHVCLRVHMQQFDRSDKSMVVVYTLVLTRCADHILPAYGPLPTSFSPHTHSEPPPPSPNP